MSDSRTKWEELENEKRNRIIGQNGNTGEHYYDNDDPDAELPPGKQLEFEFPEEVKTITEGVYELNTDAITSISDVVKILKGLNLQIVSYGELTKEQQELISSGIFKLREN